MHITDDLTKCFIGEQWTTTRTRFPVEDKFSGDVVSEIFQGNADDVYRAVQTATEALAAGIIPPYHRAEILSRASELISDYATDFMDLMIQEAGFTRIDAETETRRAAQTLMLSADVARTFSGELVPFSAHQGSEHRIGFTVRDPIGVVCAITPFNAPLNTVLHKIAPSFAAGNPTVFKPSPFTPRTGALIVQLLHSAGIPPTYLQLVQGGAETADALLNDERIAFYTFTGSTRVGQIIQSHIGLRRSQMELSSIASTIVCGDADLDLAIPRIANAGFRKAGQVCTSVQRLYVDEKIRDEVIQRLSTYTESEMRAGNPADEGTRVGPLVSEQATNRVFDVIEGARKAGAVAVTGGKREHRVITPTLLVDVPDDCDAWNKEIFGPVIAVTGFSDIGAAFRSANDTPYGLAAGVFTSNIDTALAAARELQFGTVQINETSSKRADIMPFGGIKQSGFGKEGPRYSATEMSRQRLIIINTAL